MVEPINFKNMADLKRTVDQSEAKVKPGSDKNNFASELDKQKELSESVVQNTPEADRIEIQEHQQRRSPNQRRKKKEPEDNEELVPEDDNTGTKIDTTADIRRNVPGDDEEQKVDIKI